MGSRDPRVDAYIGKSAEFARPILEKIRERVHESCPEVEETIKWSVPFFMYRGVLCNMAAFKQHCAFNFWKGSLVMEARGVAAMGQFGRLTKLSDLPSQKAMQGFVRKAMALNEQGVSSRKRKTKAGPLRVPPYFLAALRRNKQALATFEGFPPSKRRDYVDWVTEAKTEATRAKRLATSVEWLAEGKVRHWKHVK